MISYDGIKARLHAIAHKILNPKHEVIWKYGTSEDREICKGDIVCLDCDCCFWCRFYDRSIRDRLRKGVD